MFVFWGCIERWRCRIWVLTSIVMEADCVCNIIQQQQQHITFTRSYATQAHGHKLYIQIHNMVITWKNPIYTYMSKQTETTLHVQTEILRKKLVIHLNRFDYSQLHFCVQNLFIRNSPSFFRVIILFVVKSSINLYIDGLL